MTSATENAAPADGAAPGPSFEEIAETFELLDDWEDRYGYLIELGKGLPGLPETQRTSETKVDGCASQVWLWPQLVEDADGAKRLYFEGDSDAFIVRGLIAVLRALFSGRTLAEIAAARPEESFAGLGLDSALSKQRSNGLTAMVGRIQGLARSAA